MADHTKSASQASIVRLILSPAEGEFFASQGSQHRHDDAVRLHLLFDARVKMTEALQKKHPEESSSNFMRCNRTCAGLSLPGVLVRAYLSHAVLLLCYKKDINVKLPRTTEK